MMEVVIGVELVTEVHQMRTYKIQYLSYIFNVTMVGDTANYKEEEIENVPEQVLDFVESFLREEF